MNEGDERTLRGPDRRLLLIMLGIGQLSLGGLALLLGALTIVSAMFMKTFLASQPAQPGQPELPLSTIAMGTAFYVVSGAILMVMGIGAIRTRRWARNLGAAMYGLWLTIGVCALVFGVANISSTLEAASRNQNVQLPGGFLEVMQIVILLFMAVVYVAIPGGFLTGFLMPGVKTTCEYYQAEPDWTDRCPVPVLALVIFDWLMAVGFAGSIAMPVLPGFGVLVTGWPARILGLVLAIGAGYLGFLTSRLDPRAWTANLLAYIVIGVSGAITFTRVEMADFYRAFGYSEKLIEQTMQFSPQGTHFYAIMIGVTMAASIGYLFYLRRYFWQRPPCPAGQMPPPPGAHSTGTPGDR